MPPPPKLKAIPNLLDLMGISNCIGAGLHQLSSYRQLTLKQEGLAQITHAYRKDTDKKPTRTVRERKSARKPKRSIVARRRRAAVTSAMRLVSPTYLGVLAVKEREAKAAATVAAVAESALTTRCREHPKRANTRTGKKSV
jgi:hypothetical protein